jgi:hypothetical protein
VNGQQPYAVAEVSAVIIQKFHTFEKVICLSVYCLVAIGLTFFNRSFVYRTTIG